MTTNRFRWIFILGTAGAVLGVLRSQEMLALVSLSLLIWLLLRWSIFQWHLHVTLPSLQFKRLVNGSSDPKITVWTQRESEVLLTVRSKAFIPLRCLRIMDCLPEAFACKDEENVSDIVISREQPASIRYRFQARAAGTARIAGVSLRLFDPAGLYYSQEFVPLPQTCQILLMPIRIDNPSTILKSSNVVPPPGIHRLQKAGMGAELLELREYAPGDPPKSIAWKISAKRDILMTRQNESDVPIRTTIFVDRSVSTRIGHLGTRPLDQLTSLAATISKQLLSIRDPVGLTAFHEKIHVNVPFGCGNRQYYRMLNVLSDTPSPASVLWKFLPAALLEQAWTLAHERHPQLISRHVNRVPFHIFPVLPANRYDYNRKRRLIALVTELYGLNFQQSTALAYDSQALASVLQRFVLDCDQTPTGAAAVHQDSLKSNQYTKLSTVSDLLIRAASRSRDNELFVLLLDLVNDDVSLEKLLYAIKATRARNHRVMVILAQADSDRCWQGPSEFSQLATPIEMLDFAQRSQQSLFAKELRKEIRKSGATCTVAQEPKAAAMVLAEAELIRSGRTTRIG